MTVAIYAVFFIFGVYCYVASLGVLIKSFSRPWAESMVWFAASLVLIDAGSATEAQATRLIGWLHSLGWL